LNSYTGTKLLLDPDNLVTRDDHSRAYYENGRSGFAPTLIPNGKTPETVASDFLRHLYRHIISSLGETVQGEAVMEQTPIEFWFTTPNNWSNKAKLSILNAAKMAGFGSRPGDSINSIPEQEAAVIWTLAVELIGQNQPVDGILMCSYDGFGIVASN
jgi:hypothetical protein